MKFFFGLIIGIIIVGVGFAGYYFGTQQSLPLTSISSPDIKTPTAQPTKILVEYEENPSTVYTDSKATISAIKNIFTEGTSYEKLSGYSANKVNLLLYATECCGPLSRTATIKQTSDYLTGAIPPWDTDQNSSVAKKLKEKNPENFKDAIIVTSSNKYAAGFILDTDFLINKIILVSNYGLITGE